MVGEMENKTSLVKLKGKSRFLIRILISMFFVQLCNMHGTFDYV